MAVFLSRCIAHSEKSALACWVPVGGAAARPGITAARLPRCGLSRCDIGSATRSAAASAWRHWASAFRSL